MRMELRSLKTLAKGPQGPLDSHSTFSLWKNLSFIGVIFLSQAKMYCKQRFLQWHKQGLCTPNALRGRDILTDNALQRDVSFTVKETLISVHHILKNFCLATRMEHRREVKSLHYLLSKI